MNLVQATLDELERVIRVAAGAAIDPALAGRVPALTTAIDAAKTAISANDAVATMIAYQQLRDLPR